MDKNKAASLRKALGIPESLELESFSINISEGKPNRLTVSFARDLTPDECIEVAKITGWWG